MLQSYYFDFIIINLMNYNSLKYIFLIWWKWFSTFFVKIVDFYLIFWIGLTLDCRSWLQFRLYLFVWATAILKVPFFQESLFYDGQELFSPLWDEWKTSKSNLDKNYLHGITLSEYLIGKTMVIFKRLGQTSWKNVLLHL